VAKHKIAEAEQSIIENEAAQAESVAMIDGHRVFVDSVTQWLMRLPYLQICKSADLTKKGISRSMINSRFLRFKVNP